MVRLALPLSTLQRVAQHLVFYKKARVVDVYQPHTRIAVAHWVNTTPGSPMAEKFEDWHERHRGRGARFNFSQIVSAFSSGTKLQSVREQLKSEHLNNFDKVFEWFVAEGL